MRREGGRKARENRWMLVYVTLRRLQAVQRHRLPQGSSTVNQSSTSLHKCPRPMKCLSEYLRRSSAMTSVCVHVPSTTNLHVWMQGPR